MTDKDEFIWKTSISDASKENTIIRGYDINKLIGNLSFTQAIYLILKGELPSKQHKKMLDAIFVSVIDHSIAVPSVVTARTTASCGAPFNAAVAAGVLCISEYHGGAIEQAAKLFQEELKNTKEAKEAAKNIVNKISIEKKRMPGYGHKIYTEDKRALHLLKLAKEFTIAGKHTELAIEVEKELEKAKGKKLCLNVDAAIAGIISDMGFDWQLGKAFFIISRTVGLCAHVHEEQTQEKPFRRLPEDICEYTGKPLRKLPK